MMEPEGGQLAIWPMLQEGKDPQSDWELREKQVYEEVLV